MNLWLNARKTAKTNEEMEIKWKCAVVFVFCLSSFIVHIYVYFWRTCFFLRIRVIPSDKSSLFIFSEVCCNISLMELRKRWLLNVRLIKLKSFIIFMNFVSLIRKRWLSRKKKNTAFSRFAWKLPEFIFCAMSLR